jgi:hypothetical protein
MNWQANTHFMLKGRIAVSKHGQQTWCSFPPFETRPAAAPQGEALL